MSELLKDEDWPKGKIASGAMYRPLEDIDLAVLMSPMQSLLSPSQERRDKRAHYPTVDWHSVRLEPTRNAKYSAF